MSFMWASAPHERLQFLSVPRHMDMTWKRPKHPHMEDVMIFFHSEVRNVWLTLRSVSEPRSLNFIGKGAYLPIPDKHLRIINIF